jgi:hypothetical protein
MKKYLLIAFITFLLQGTLIAEIKVLTPKKFESLLTKIADDVERIKKRYNERDPYDTEEEHKNKLKQNRRLNSPLGEKLKEYYIKNGGNMLVQNRIEFMKYNPSNQQVFIKIKKINIPTKTVYPKGGGAGKWEPRFSLSLQSSFFLTKLKNQIFFSAGDKIKLDRKSARDKYDILGNKYKGIFLFCEIVGGVGKPKLRVTSVEFWVQNKKTQRGETIWEENYYQ